MRLARILAIALITTCTFVASGMAPGNPPRINVMTWNICFGGGGGGSFDLGSMFESVQDTNFPQRASRIARIIDQHKPHVICLQEVARWRTETFLGQERDDIDFLQILQSRLLARGLRYDLIGTLETIDFEAPGQVHGDVRNIRWQERIVILARRSSALHVNTVRTRRYSDIETIPTPVGSLRFKRGWIAADITFRGKKARYVCTHLEALSGSTRADQAEQLINWLSGTGLPVIVMGDLNAVPATNAYQQFIDAGYDDAWTAYHNLFAGPTCCQNGDLDNNSSTLTTRLDHILLRGPLTPISSARVGQKQSDRTPVPARLWPSDHAGVVARIRLE